MRRAAIALVAILVVPLASCSGSDGDDDAYVLRLEGVATVTTEDGRDEVDDGEHRLAIGDRVEVTEGSAVLGLPGDGSLELRAGRAAAAAAQLVSTAPSERPVGRPTPNSTVVVARRPTLVSGDGLLVTGDGTAAVEAGAATVRLTDGAARIRRSTGVTVGVYAGEATVEALGRSLGGGLPAYRQVAVSDSGSLPRRAAPFVYDRRRPDPWDLRYLGEAIDLGEQLDRRSLAVTRQLPSTSVDAESLESLVPELASADGFDDGLVGRGRSLGETLVGASIALDGPEPFARRWKEAFRFREQGADWGLVALDQRAERAALISLLDGVLREVPAFFTAAPVGSDGPAPVVTPIGTGVAGTPPAAADDDTDAAPPPSEPPPPQVAPVPTPSPLIPPGAAPLLPPVTIPILPSPQPAPAPAPAPSSPLPTEPLAPVTGTIGGLLGDGTDAIGGLIGDTEEAVSGVVEEVGGTVETVTEGLGGLLGSTTDALLGPTAG